jgi:hypothetical protein
MSVSVTRPTQAARITTIEHLYEYLYTGLQLEHATIPPYLTALYSLHREKNADAWHVIRVVAVEEMLHLTLVANVMNAVRGTPDLLRSGFVPDYPTHLPCGVDDFEVHLAPFSRDAVSTFLKIERPPDAPSEEGRVVPLDWSFAGLAADGAGRPSERELAAVAKSGAFLGVVPGHPDMRFYSIGEFYEEIIRGINYLEDEAREEGKTIFTGNPSLQVTPEFFYSGGGDVIPVTSRDSAVQALTLIAEQGEGLVGGIYDSQGELAHYYRFDQLFTGRYYQEGDEAGHPSGPELHVDWDAAYPVQQDVKLADYPKDSEVLKAAVEFNQSYVNFLTTLNLAFNGQPELLLKGVWEMFRVRDTMTRLIHNPLPNRPGVNAGPTFELYKLAKEAES